MHFDLTIQILSLIGAFSCVIAYIAHQLTWMDPRKALYNLLNVVGSGFLVFVAFHPFQAGFVVMETVWGLTSLYGLYKSFTYKKTA